MTKKHKPRPPRKCQNCGQHVKGSNITRHQASRCPKLRALRGSGWLVVHVNKKGTPGFGRWLKIKQLGLPTREYVVTRGRVVTTQVWVPHWAYVLLINNQQPTYLRNALLEASIKDEQLCDAIYAALMADAWDVAEDLLPERPIP